MKHTSSGHFTPAAAAACAGFVLCWTVGPIFIKQLSDVLDVWTQNAARYGVACLFWLPFLLLYGRQGLTLPLLKKAIVPAAFNIVMQTCWAGAFYYADPAFAVLLSRSSILWVSLFSLLFFADERPLAKSKLFWAGSAAAVVGLAGVILCSPDLNLSGTWMGVAIALCSSVTWAGYALSVKVVFREVDSKLSFSIITVYTVIGLTTLAFLLGEPTALAELSPKNMVILVVSAVTAIAIAHVFFYSAVRRIGATIPSMINLLTPFCVLLLSRVVFDEQLTAGQWIFGLLLVLGIALAANARRKMSVLC
jgi:drug/metabolite transporter (DMT)-like permease